MCELCLSMEEQVWLVQLISTNTETAAKFMDNLNEKNVTEYDQEYIALMTECYHSSKKLGQVIDKIQNNIARYEDDRSNS
jgi:uridine phosphorylase